jgi:hypothetical protein
LRISLQPSAAASGGEGSAVLLTLADVRPVPGVLSPALPLLLPGVLSRGVEFDGAPASRARGGTGGVNADGFPSGEAGATGVSTAGEGGATGVGMAGDEGGATGTGGGGGGGGVMSC